MHKATLTWIAASSTDEPIVSYDIQRALKTAGVIGAFATIGNVTADKLTYEDDAVTAGVTYEYQVLARTATVLSGPSNEVQAIIPFLGPGAPSGLVVVAV